MVNDREQYEEKAPILAEEYKALIEENKALSKNLKKLERELEKERMLIQRYRGNSEAKRQFSEMVLAERTRLELQMNLLLQNSRDFFLFFDAGKHLITCTESLLRALGIPGLGLIKSQSFEEIFDGLIPDDVMQQVSSCAVADEGGAMRESLSTQVCADLQGGDDPRDYTLHVLLMRDDAQTPQGWLILFYDNTELVQARREAEKANHAKSEFLAKISHDIRSPMNAIIGLSRMLDATSLDAQQQLLLEKMQGSSTALLALINDLLDFSKIEAGKLDIVDDYFDFKEFLNELSSIFEVMLYQKELALHTHFSADIPQVICSDSKRLRQILTNLVNNAYKYTPSGWIDFSVSREVGGFIRLEVHDTGIGIREDELGKLFKAFEQLDVRRNRDITGTGLGLAITKQLVELMGGTIEVTSVYGEGSTFCVLLPIKEGSTSNLKCTETVCYRFTAPKARVLVVDDVAVNNEIAEFMLEDFDVQVTKATDGQQAVDLVQQQQFDLVMMDHMMPIMDGIEATRRIRELGGPMSVVPVIAMTANAVSGVEAIFYEAGFNGYISKPMNEALLSAVLYEHLPKELICIPIPDAGQDQIPDTETSLKTE